MYAVQAPRQLRKHAPFAAKMQKIGDPTIFDAEMVPLSSHPRRSDYLWGFLVTSVRIWLPDLAT